MAKPSGEKSEKPTPKKLKDARKKGQIPKSVDLVQWLVLLMSTWFVPSLIKGLGLSLRAETVTLMHAAATGQLGLVVERLDDILILMTAALLPMFGLVCLTIVVGLGLQGGVVISADGIKPKPERISPKAGFKRLVSSEPLVDTVKSIIRLLVLGVLSATVLRAILEEHLLPIPVALDAAALRLGQQMLDLVRMVAFAGLLVGGGDYAYQRWKINKQLKMTKEEVKQEYKQSEGDPAIKGRRRQAHAKLTRNQMLAAVDDASAVIVNPTHVAVAIRYQEGTGAPRVVAKGGDELAMRIRERAKAKGVPIVEARPLARILHDRVEVGETVPNELFRAIAIVLAFVMRNPNSSFSDTIRRVKIPASAMRLPDEDPNAKPKPRRRAA